MHDGQNLFDPEKANIGVDWGVVPALMKLIEAGSVPEVILVGIWCTEKRVEEYLPQRPFEMSPAKFSLSKLRFMLRGKPKSDAYLRFLVEELKPFIDKQYRTLADQAYTNIMGSSRGGLISLYALCQYPHIFRGAGCLSTHWPAVEGVILHYLAQTLPESGTHCIYFDYGTETLDAQYEPYQMRVD